VNARPAHECRSTAHHVPAARGLESAGDDAVDHAGEVVVGDGVALHLEDAADQTGARHAAQTGHDVGQHRLLR
jgi:hypothetical protein